MVCEAVESSGLGHGSWCIWAGDLAAVIFKANTAFLLDNQWSEKEAIHSFIHSFSKHWVPARGQVQGTEW